MFYIACGVAVCCSVLQCVAVCCSVLQCDAMCYSLMQRVTVNACWVAGMQVDVIGDMMLRCVCVCACVRVCVCVCV